MTGYKERQLQRAYEAIQQAGRGGLTRAQVSQVLGLKNGTQVHGLMLELVEMGLVVCDRSADLLVAQGIWNLARSGAEFRRAVAEAARVAAPGAGLFVFTFSRHTLPPDACPVAGETFVFTQFSGQPQCFLTSQQLLEEMARAGFVPDAAVPLAEHNLPPAGAIHAVRAPVIYEAAFRRS